MSKVLPSLLIDPASEDILPVGEGEGSASHPPLHSPSGGTSLLSSDDMIEIEELLMEDADTGRRAFARVLNKSRVGNLLVLALTFSTDSHTGSGDRYSKNHLHSFIFSHFSTLDCVENFLYCAFCSFAHVPVCT